MFYKIFSTNRNTWGAKSDICIFRKPSWWPNFARKRRVRSFWFKHNFESSGNLIRILMCLIIFIIIYKMCAKIHYRSSSVWVLVKAGASVARWCFLVVSRFVRPPKISSPLNPAYCLRPKSSNFPKSLTHFKMSLEEFLLTSLMVWVIFRVRTG